MVTVSIIIDVVDRLIALVKRREEVSRARYDDVVKPLMADVDALHRDYLTTFRKYRDALVDGKSVDAAFMDAIAADSLFSRDLRSRVRAAADSDGDDRLRPLKIAVLAYLQLATVNPLAEWDEEVMYEMGHYSYHSEAIDQVRRDAVDALLERTLEDWGILFIMNASRLMLANGIASVVSRGLSPQLTTRLVIRMIESVVIELQRRYGVITRAHTDVRKALLDPK